MSMDCIRNYYYIIGSFEMIYNANFITAESHHMHMHTYIFGYVATGWFWKLHLITAI